MAESQNQNNHIQIQIDKHEDKDINNEILRNSFSFEIISHREFSDIEPKLDDDWIVIKKFFKENNPLEDPEFEERKAQTMSKKNPSATSFVKKFTFIRTTPKVKKIKKVDSSHENDSWKVCTPNIPELRLLAESYTCTQIAQRCAMLRDAIKKSVYDNLERTVERLRNEQETARKIHQIVKGVPRNQRRGCAAIFACCGKTKKKETLQNSYSLKDCSNDVINRIAEMCPRLHRFTSIDSSIDNFITDCQESALLNISSRFDHLIANDSKFRQISDLYFQIIKEQSQLQLQEEKLKKQMKKLEAFSDIQTLKECIVCMAFERAVIFIPCAHFICCNSCSEKIGSVCPECHQEIESKEIIAN